MDKTVIYRIREEVVDSDHMLDVKFDERSLRGILDKYRWYPEAMNREYGLLPSSYLNCAVDAKQHSFLNPTMRDVLLSTLEQDVVWNYAKKKRARCRMDFLDGNAKSYSKWLNSPQRMEKYADQNALVGILAEMKVEKEEEKKKQKEKKSEYEKERKRKNKEKAERKLLEKEREEPIAAANVVKGLDHVLKLTVVKMRKILVHYYGENETAMNKLRRPEIESLIRDKMNADPIQPEPTQPNQTQTNATPTDPIRTEPTRTQPNQNEPN